MEALMNSILVAAILSIICLCRNVDSATSLNCGEVSVNVREGTELFTWECQANDILLTNAIALAIRGTWGKWSA